MTHSIVHFYKQLVTSHSIVKIWKIPLKLLDTRYYKERELGRQMLAYLSHTRPFGFEAFSFACVLSGDVKDCSFWCPKDGVFSSFSRELN